MVKNWKKVTYKIIVASLISLFIFVEGTYSKVNAQKYIMTYLYGNEDYIAMINERGNSLNEVSPSYFDINEDGSLKVNYIDKNFVDKMHDKNIKVVPFFSNHWNRDNGRKALQNYEKNAVEIAKVIEVNNLDGINVDVENLTELDRENYINFVKKLREKLPKNKEVVVSVAANPYGVSYGWQGSYDYKELAQYADYIMVMAYDEHYEGGENGPVASLDFVDKSLKYAINNVSKEKVVLGIPLYGRYWNETTNSGGYGVSLNKIDEIIKNYSSQVTYDESTASVKAVVTIKNSGNKLKINGKTLEAGKYIFWYENEKSIDAKLDLINKYDIKGVGMWKLGLETDSVWNAIENKFKKVVDEIKQIFKDVSENYWAYNDIKFVFEKDLMIGRDGKIFEPEISLTRGELATIISRLIEDLKLNLKKSENIVAFNDVSNHWAKDYIMNLNQYDLITGYEDGTFRADKKVTRAEVSTIVSRLIKNAGAGDIEKIYTKSNYLDLSKEHWAYENIMFLQEKGILKGYEDGSFRAENSIKRGEVAKIIRKICENL